MKKSLFASLTLALAISYAPQTHAAAEIASCAPPAVKKPVKRVVRKSVARPASKAAPQIESLAPDRYYQQALLALKQGRVADAQSLLVQQLQLTPAHEAARKLQATLLLDAGKRQEAEVLLTEGLQHRPASPDTAMTLARLQAERGALNEARATLQNGAARANGNAPYLAFMAALEQKAGEHQKADELLTQALKIQPGTGKWLLAQGLSRQALKNDTGARTSYEAALASTQLNAAEKIQARQGLAGLRREAR